MGLNIFKQGGAILQQGGALLGGFNKSSSGADDPSVGRQIARGADNGIAGIKNWFGGISTEEAVKKAEAELRTIDAKGIKISGSVATDVGRLVQATVGAGNDGKVGSGSMAKVNAWLVKNFAPEQEQPAAAGTQREMGAVETGYDVVSKGITGIGSFFGNAVKNITSTDLADKYPKIAEQVADAIKAHKGTGPVQVLKGAGEISGPMVAAMCQELREKDAFDGNAELTGIAGRAFGEAAQTAGDNYQYLQGLANKLAPNDVPAPTGDKITPVSPENEVSAPSTDADMSPK